MARNIKKGKKGQDHTTPESARRNPRGIPPMLVEEKGKSKLIIASKAVLDKLKNGKGKSSKQKNYEDEGDIYK